MTCATPLSVALLCDHLQTHSTAAAEAGRRKVRVNRVGEAHQRGRRTRTAAPDRSRAVLVSFMEDL